MEQVMTTFSAQKSPVHAHAAAATVADVPRAYPTGGSATLGDLLADGNRGSGGRS
jgi:hypothetical protein